MKHISEIIDDILVEWSYRVHDGMPNPKNPLHLIHLEDTLNELKLPRKVVKKVLEKVRKYKDNKMNKDLGRVGEPWGSDKGDTEKKGSGESTEKGKSSQTVEDVTNEQQKIEDDRDKGIAGAGGPVASQGESRYCNACNNLNEEEFKVENKEAINAKKEEISSRKLKADEKRTIQALGLSEEDGIEYLASREVWAEQELERIEKDPDSVFYKKGKKGFGGPGAVAEEAYKEWMRTAYDGALATQQILEEDSNLDISQPHTIVQSTPELDVKVESQMEDNIKNAKTSEEKAYYESELKAWKKYSKYHDTYVVGVDDQGRTHIVHISNKKDDNLKDPHNNTTPAERFKVLKESYGEEVAQNVAGVMDESIGMVTEVREETATASAEVEIDDDFAAVAEKAAGTYVKDLDKRAKNPKDTYGKWVAEKYPNWDKLSTSDKLKVMQQFMKDEDWHKANGPKNYKPPYKPFSKIFIKVGEAAINKSFWAKNPELNREGKGIAQSSTIKENEKSVVTRAHGNVVNVITEQDKKLGYPKDGENGPNTKGYINTVMDAMHFNTYIDGGDGKVIIQMGIRGAKPKHIRDCLSKLSGYEGDTSTSEGREALKKHMRSRCKVDSDSGAVYIEGPDGRIKIAEDTWRTAGDAQKVASGFGDDMKKCVSDGVDKDRASKKK
jgi:hypothetical protein